MKRIISLISVFLLVICIALGLFLHVGIVGKAKPHVHSFNVEVIAPTCSQEGYTINTCKSCGFKEQSDYTPALQDDGHNYVDCICSLCGDFLIEEAVDTATLSYEKSVDSDGNEVYIVTGITETAEYIKIPSSYNGIPVTQIADEAFARLKELKHVIIPDTVVSIGDYAFCWCYSLKSVGVPNSIVSIGKWAFANCNRLENISISGLTSLTEIEDVTFACCSSITDFEIPEGVTSICEDAFGSCTSLTSITIPASVTYIDNGAFLECKNLENIYYNGTIVQWMAITKETEYYITYTNKVESWNAYTGDYTIHCIDGSIKKNNSLGA